MPGETKEIDADTLLGCKPRVLAVDVSEWFGDGATIHVREASTAEAFKATESKGDAEQSLEWFSLCVCNASGERLFQNGQASKAKELPASMFRKVVEAAMEVNGFTDEDDDETKN